MKRDTRETGREKDRVRARDIDTHTHRDKEIERVTQRDP